MSLAVERVYEKGKSHDGFLLPPPVPSLGPAQHQKHRVTKAGRMGSVYEWRWCPKHNHPFKVKQESPDSLRFIGHCPYCYGDRVVKHHSKKGPRPSCSAKS